MTPSQNINTADINGGSRAALRGAKVASTICLLAGIWLFVSPWVYGAFTQGSAWNSWIVGGLLILFAIARIARPALSIGLSWCNMILGIWVFLSAWIYGYSATNAGRFVNSLCVGVIVFIFAIISAKASSSRTAEPAGWP